MKTVYTPAGVCSKQYELDVDEEGVIRDIKVTGGCNGNLKGISELIKGRKAEEVIPLIRGLKCGSRPTSCPDQISYALEEALNAAQKTYSSGSEFNMDKEFIFSQYKLLNKEINPEFGVESADDVVIRMVNIDTLCYMFNSPGAHLVLFGGTWSEATCSIMDQVNYYARKYGVDEVYLFDFSCTGLPGETIKLDITSQPDYNGPGKRTANPFADFNYIYGEIVTRYLTNLNDWAARKTGSDDDITYLNVYQDPVTVPDVTEPFLFIYNKDNTIDHSGAVREAGYVNEAGTYPIVYGMELKAYRNMDDLKFYRDPSLQNTGTYIDGFSSIIEKGIFSHIGEEGAVTAPYTNADYVREAFAVNHRGHSYKTEDAFEKDEPVNIHTITFQQFRWMAKQKGSFMFYLAGPWCAFSQGGIATVNDYARANDVQVYMVDSRLDSKHAIDFWMYPRLKEPKLTNPAMLRYYVEIWEEYFPCVQILCNIDPARYWSRPTIDYTDGDGKKHTVLAAGIPFLLAYNKDHLNKNGQKRPVLASKHDAGELINCSEVYVYYEPFYKKYKAGISYVFHEYMKAQSKEFHEITIDRSKPVVEGMPEKHPETIAYHKDHDWFKELAAAGGKFANLKKEDLPKAEVTVEESDGCC